MNRKQRRQLARKTSPELADKVSEKVALFNKLPSSCSACSEEFDNRDKDMIKSWRVVVRQEVVRLFCPTCIKKTQEVLDENKSLIHPGTP